MKKYIVLFFVSCCSLQAMHDNQTSLKTGAIEQLSLLAQHERIITQKKDQTQWDPDSKVTLWSFKDGEPLKDIDAHMPIHFLTTSHDGTKLATIKYAQNMQPCVVTLWDIETASCLSSYIDRKLIDKAQFSPDDKTLLLAKKNKLAGKTLIYDTQRGAITHKYPRNYDFYSTDNKHGAYLTNADIIKIDNFETQKEIGTLHDSQVGRILFGNRYFSWRSDNQIIATKLFRPYSTCFSSKQLPALVALWNIFVPNQTKVLYNGTGPAHNISTITFTEDNNYLLTSDCNLNLKAWDTNKKTVEKSGKLSSQAYQVIESNGIVASALYNDTVEINTLADLS